jgi:hypothetical protein
MEDMVQCGDGGGVEDKWAQEHVGVQPMMALGMRLWHGPKFLQKRAIIIRENCIMGSWCDWRQAPALGYA